LRHRETLGGERLWRSAHVAREGDVENLSYAVHRFGGLDILINNVGMNLLTASVTDTELAVWNKTEETHRPFPQEGGTIAGKSGEDREHLLWPGRRPR
jgi:NAD(P)-dependent dehydrogenase (short-subunit alcohol dehydrogenase family)